MVSVIVCLLFCLTKLWLPGDGPAIQSALAGWTGQRTVPNVFIGGKHVGGCDGEPFHKSHNYCHLYAFSDNVTFESVCQQSVFSAESR